PLLTPKLATRLAALAEGFDAVAPHIDGQWYPLTAVYRTKLHTLIDERLVRGERRVIDFVETIKVRRIDRNELRLVDQQLLSLRNCNTEEEYRELLLAFDAKTRRE
ncbi:MAG: molybdenum cofactor guanylyltransferase, partial [Aeoliella sp.]